MEVMSCLIGDMCSLSALVSILHCFEKRITHHVHHYHKINIKSIALTFAYIFSIHVIQIYSGITSARVLDGELLYTEILEILRLPT